MKVRFISTRPGISGANDGQLEGLKALGCEIVKEGKDADVIFFGVCACCSSSDVESLGLEGQRELIFSGPKVIVVDMSPGCYEPLEGVGVVNRSRSSPGNGERITAEEMYAAAKQRLGLK